MDDFGANYVTITDEDGVDYELEILATVENGGNLYYALAPAGDDEAEEELEISILINDIPLACGMLGGISSADNCDW